MITKIKFIIIFLFSLTILSATNSYAGSISLDLINQEVTSGDSLIFELSLDFSDDPTIGGGLDIFYDSNMLDFVSFEFDDAFNDDPVFRNTPADLLGEIDGISFGNFFGISGPTLIGTLTFETFDIIGSTFISLAENDTNMGGFYSSETSLSQAVTFNGANVDIAAPIPEPSTLVLFGFGCLILVRRRFKKA